MEILLMALLILVCTHNARSKIRYFMACCAAALCALTLLTACSPNDNQTPAPKLFKQERELIDKAKAIEPAQQQQDEAQRKATEY